MFDIDRGLYVATSAMMSGTKRIDDIANNIANINTTGYKKDISEIKQFSNLLINKLNDNIDIGTLQNQVYIEDTYTNFKQGMATETGMAKDFMIQGDGFFKIQKDGQYLYTRDGAFNVDVDGYLVTKDGGYVMDKGNQRVKPGDIANGHPELQLMVVDFDNKQTLDKMENGYYRNQFNLSQEKSVNNSNVKQGWLEMSNVDAADEMTDLMQMQRYFGLNQRSLKANDELLEKMIQF